MLVKGLVKPQEDDLMFKALDKLFDIQAQEVEQETSEDIKQRILNKVKGGG